jgi:hypothetical protein
MNLLSELRRRNVIRMAGLFSSAYVGEPDDAHQFSAIYIKFVGTHAQYDAINAATV